MRPTVSQAAEVDDIKFAHLLECLSRVMSYRKTDAFQYRSAEEDTASFGTDHVYNYAKDAGFRRAGGFVEMLNFDEHKHVILNKIAALRRNGWFNLKQGSLVVELLVWNGNVERLLHTAFVFEHDFSERRKHRSLSAVLRSTSTT